MSQPKEIASLPLNGAKTKNWRVGIEQSPRGFTAQLYFVNHFCAGISAFSGSKGGAILALLSLLRDLAENLPDIEELKGRY